MLHLRSTDLNIHPAGRINNFGKLVEVNRNIILNICMEGLIKGLNCQLRPAIRIGGVDFIFPIAVDIYQRIARNGNYFYLVVLIVNCQHHQRVCPTLNLSFAPGIHPAKQNIGYAVIPLDFAVDSKISALENRFNS